MSAGCEIFPIDRRILVKERNKRSQHTQHLLGLFVFFTRSSCVFVNNLIPLFDWFFFFFRRKNKPDCRTPFFFFFFPLFFLTQPWVRDTVFTNQTTGTRHFWIFFGAHTHTQTTNKQLSLSPWWSCAKMPKSSNFNKKVQEEEETLAQFVSLRRGG